MGCLCDAGGKEAVGRLESSIARASGTLRRGLVTQRAMWSKIVILVAPAFKDDSRLTYLISRYWKFHFFTLSKLFTLTALGNHI
jgi:hypothetical protein